MAESYDTPATIGGDKIGMSAQSVGGSWPRRERRQVRTASYGPVARSTWVPLARPERTDDPCEVLEQEGVTFGQFRRAASSRRVMPNIGKDEARQARRLLADKLHGHKYAIDAVLAVIARQQKGQVTVFTSDVDDLEKLVPDTIVVKTV